MVTSNSRCHQIESRTGENLFFLLHI